MSLKPTRKMEFQNLTATGTKQDVTLQASYKHTQIRVITAGKIRVQINETPSELTASNGITVDTNAPLVINNHFIRQISCIRDTNTSVNVDFEIIGFWREN